MNFPYRTTFYVDQLVLMVKGVVAERTDAEFPESLRWSNDDVFALWQRLKFLSEEELRKIIHTPTQSGE